MMCGANELEEWRCAHLIWPYGDSWHGGSFEGGEVVLLLEAGESGSERSQPAEN